MLIQPFFIRRLLLLFLPITLAVGVGAAFIFYAESQRLHAERAADERAAIHLGATSIILSLQEISHDLLYVARQSRLQEAIESADEDHFDRLAEEWIAFSRGHHIYDQIRWVDETGMERVRVDYAQGKPVAVPRAELQNKRDEFGDVIKRTAGEIHLSPLDLKIEHDRIEVPYKPTIRVGTPVFDRHGAQCGMVLLHYMAADLLNRFGQTSGIRAWLLDRDGYWLKGPQPADEWGFMFHREDLTLAYRYPGVWQRLQAADAGQFETAEGLWSFETVFPLQQQEPAPASDGTRLSVVAGRGAVEPGGYAWKAVSLLPADEYNVGARRFGAQLGAATALILVLLFAGCCHMAQVRVARDAAHGDLERLVAERTRELQRINRNLAASEERWSFALEGAGEGVWDWNIRTGEALFSRRWKEMIGYVEDEIGGRFEEWEKRLHPDDRARAAAAFRAYLNGETAVYVLEHRLRCKDGGYKWILARGTLVSRTAEGRPLRMVGTHSDLSEHKRTEEKLRTLSAAIEQAPVSVVITDLEANIQYVNPRFTEVTGYAADEVIGQNPRILQSSLTPKETHRALWDALTSNRVWQGELVNRRKNGEIYWEDAHIAPVTNAEGVTTHYVGVKLEITQRKRAQEELQLASLVYQHTSEAMMVTDASNRIVAINPAFTQMTGYTPNEVIGKNPNILRSGRQDSHFYRNFWQALETTGHWQGEIWNRRKDGEVYPEWMTINTIYDEPGSVYRRVALFSDISERKQSEELIWRQANFDPLTQLPNRSMFRDRLDQDIKKTQRAGLSVALLFIDLDRFKEINDTLGHRVGDLLLAEAARRICDCVRESDTVARLGGDEFTVILGQLPDDSHVERVAQSILTRLAEPFHLGDEIVYVTASIGITLYPDDASELETLLKNADQAMYLAKNQGRNRFSYFTPSLQTEAQARLRLISDLHGALANGQFMVYFQPIVEPATGRVFKAEALLRWQHPERGQILPKEFIPVAEEIGLIVEIGDWVFKEAMRWAKRWNDLCVEGFQVSVNKSPVQFRAPGFDHHDGWLAHMRELGLPGQSLTIEITEGLLLDLEAGIADQLLMFEQAGIQVAIDDFGTGYSALSYLKKFHIDYLKIDQSFVDNLVTDASDRALVEAIIVMAHKLGLHVIAEGVETDAQRVFLVAAGCDFGQGHLFSKPVPPEEFEALLKKSLA